MASSRDFITSFLTINKYRKLERAFSRTRKIPFSNLVILLLQKSLKSLQIKLNEFADLVGIEPATASAFTQARALLSHELFKDLNSLIYSKDYYEQENYKTYKGHRLLAIDGSYIRLPKSKAIEETYGKITLKNQHQVNSYTGGLCSALYDVLNEIVISAELANSLTAERTLAEHHFDHTKVGDIVVLDRGYPGYKFFAVMLSKKLHFICRCGGNMFADYHSLFVKDKNQDELIVEMLPHRLRASDIADGFQKSLRVRLVKVVLNSGEIEVLATSLLDQEKYPKRDFKDLYSKRWGIETLYDRVKNRLSLENFSGKSVEAVKQDFYSTIFITNVEVDVTTEANRQLKIKCDIKANQYQQKVNRSTSFNGIKRYAVDLFLESEKSVEDVVEELGKLFRASTIPIRPGRKFPRKKGCPRMAVNYLKYSKKMIF